MKYITGLLGLFLIAGLSTGCDTSSAGNEYGAKDACKEWVKDQLKAPSTAEFENVSASSGAGPWTVIGDVDAENGFGAKIRIGWTCEVRLDGDYYRGSATLFE